MIRLAEYFQLLVVKLRNPISPLVISFFLFRLLSHHYLARNNGSCIPAHSFIHSFFFYS